MKSNLLEKIDKVILNKLKDSKVTNDSLYNGRLGMIMYLATRFSSLNNKDEVSWIIEVEFGNILNGDDHIKHKSSLMYGTSGLLYLYNYLVKLNIVAKNTNLEKNLSYFIKSNINLREIDLFNGFTGSLITIIGNQKLNHQSYLLGDKILDHIDYNLIVENDICIWVNREVKQNIGVAHGLPNLMYLMVHLHKHTKNERCLIIYQTIKKTFLKIATNTSNSKFTYNYYCAIEEHDKVDFKHRLSWCYCDLGIGLVLYKVAEYFADKDFMDFCSKLLVKTTSIQDQTDSGVSGLGICHGLFGISYLYSKAFCYTGDIRLFEAQQYWKSKGLTEFKLNEIDDYGFLNGLSGIGLVLHSMENKDKANSWDQCLLLS